MGLMEINCYRRRLFMLILIGIIFLINRDFIAVDISKIMKPICNSISKCSNGAWDDVCMSTNGWFNGWIFMGKWKLFYEAVSSVQWTAYVLKWGVKFITLSSERIRFLKYIFLSFAERAWMALLRNAYFYGEDVKWQMKGETLWIAESNRIQNRLKKFLRIRRIEFIVRVNSRATTILFDELFRWRLMAVT